MPSISSRPRIRARTKAAVSWSSEGISSKRRKRRVGIGLSARLALAFQLDCLLNGVAELGDHLLVLTDLLQCGWSVGTELAEAAFERHGHEVGAVVVRHKGLQAH